MINFTNDFICSIEELKSLKKYYELEYHRTNNEKFQINFEKIERYLNEYYNILEKIENSTELKLYKYLNLGLTPSKAVEKVANENYLNNLKPTSLSNIWNHYKKLQKILKTGVK